MNASRATRRLLAGLASLALLSSCGSGASPTQAPSSTGPADPSSAPVSPPAPTATTAATPVPSPGVTATYDVAFEATNPVLVPGTLDVYTPAGAGQWPVVVMFHGAPGSSPKLDRAGLSEQARRVAELGFVVFNASWGHLPGASPSVPDPGWLRANNAQAACAVEFARSHASEYGGDPSTMIVFGHSGGAHVAAMATFARSDPTAGCPGGAMLGPIDALVTWEGNWILSVNAPDWDAALAADPQVWDIVTPWSYLAAHTDQKVVMLVSENPGAFFERKTGDPWSADSWFAVRDPSGDLRRQLEAGGEFADGSLGMADVQRLLYSTLKAQGNPVSLDVMPGSAHDRLGVGGWPVFLAAFQKAAGRV